MRVKCGRDALITKPQLVGDAAWKKRLDRSLAHFIQEPKQAYNITLPGTYPHPLKLYANFSN